MRVAGIEFWKPVKNNGKILQKDGFIFTKMTTGLIYDTLKADNVTYERFSREEGGEIGIDGIASGVIGDVLNGQYESSRTGHYNHGFWKQELNLYVKTGMCFVIKKDISVIEQLHNLFSLVACLMFLLSFTMITVLLTYLLRTTHLDVGMDMIRAAVGVSMIHVKPHSRISQLIFVCIIFSFIVLSSYLQSQFSAVLITSSGIVSDIRSTSDLLKHGYKMYGHNYFLQFYYNTPLNGHISSIETFEKCLKLMKSDDLVACLEDCSWNAYNELRNDELQIEDEFLDRSLVLLFRYESPLFNSAKRIYDRLFECGVVEHLNHFDHFMFKSKHPRVPHKISMQQLRYAFYLLVISGVLSVFIFLIELQRM